MSHTVPALDCLNASEKRQVFRSTQYTPIRKKQQDEYCAKTMFEFPCQTFCILRSREEVIQAHCFVGLEK